MSDKILTVKEIGCLLKAQDERILSMDLNGEFPAFKVRGQSRIPRVAFASWTQNPSQKPQALDQGKR